MISISSTGIRDCTSAEIRARYGCSGRRVDHRAHRLAVDLEGEQRAIGDKRAAFAISLDPAIPAELAVEIHILPRAALESS